MAARRGIRRRNSASNLHNKPANNNHADVFTVLQYAPNQGELFTIIIYDIDHQHAPFAQSIITNVPGEDINAGEVLLPHIPIIHGEPHHRYVVDAYRQRGRSVINFMLNDTDRPHFDVDAFVNENRLVLVSRQILRNQFGLGLALLLGGLAIGGIAGYGIARSTRQDY